MPAPAPPPDRSPDPSATPRRSGGRGDRLALAALALAVAAATAVFATWETEVFVGAGGRGEVGYRGLGAAGWVWWDGTGRGHLGAWVLVPAAFAGLAVAITHVIGEPARRTRSALAVVALVALVAATAASALDLETRSATTRLPAGSTIPRELADIPGEYYVHESMYGSRLAGIFSLAATCAVGLRLVLDHRARRAALPATTPSGTERRRVVEAVVVAAGAAGSLATLLPWIESDGGQWTPVGLGILGYRATDPGLHGRLVLVAAGAGVVMALAGARARAGEWLRGGGLASALAAAALTLALGVAWKDVLDYPPLDHWVRGPGVPLCVGSLTLATVGAAVLALPRRRGLGKA